MPLGGITSLKLLLLSRIIGKVLVCLQKSSYYGIKRDVHNLVFRIFEKGSASYIEIGDGTKSLFFKNNGICFIAKNTRY